MACRQPATQEVSHVNRFGLPLILSVLAALAVAACGREDATPSARESQRNDSSAAATETAPMLARSPRDAPKRAPASARATPRPSIEIVRPVAREAVRGDAVTVSVVVKAFKLVNQRVRPPFPPPVAGQGHVHYYLDTKSLPTTHSRPATGVYRSIPATDYTWTGVAPGKRSFAVQLVGRDHAPLTPPVTDRITLDVR